MRLHPEIRVEIVGHTAWNEAAEYGRTPNERMLRVMRKFLIDDEKINAERIEFRSVGSDEPLASVKTAEGRRKNRRIDFKLLTD